MDQLLQAASQQEGPLPLPAELEADPRVRRAWREWLGALATDAEAALAAALAYGGLDAKAREDWLRVLEHDAPKVSAPVFALYAPLLAVESDPKRRERIEKAAGTPSSCARLQQWALGGRAETGSRLLVLVVPLYLDFVRVLACTWQRGRGFISVQHDPIVESSRAPRAGERLLGVLLDTLPFQPAVDDLALAILDHRRTGKPLPDALLAFADLLNPCATTVG
jgi:hypothetical protein